MKSRSSHGRLEKYKYQVHNYKEVAQQVDCINKLWSKGQQVDKKTTKPLWVKTPMQKWWREVNEVSGRREEVGGTKGGGPYRDLNSGPLPPKGRIIPLDHTDRTGWAATIAPLRPSAQHDLCMCPPSHSKLQQPSPTNTLLTPNTPCLPYLFITYMSLSPCITSYPPHTNILLKHMIIAPHQDTTNLSNRCTSLPPPPMLSALCIYLLCTTHLVASMNYQYTSVLSMTEENSAIALIWHMLACHGSVLILE